MKLFSPALSVIHRDKATTETETDDFWKEFQAQSQANNQLTERKLLADLKKSPIFEKRYKANTSTPSIAEEDADIESHVND